MDRCKEYSCFALSFAGLGYIALRLLTRLRSAAALSGIAIHSPVLPPALNAIGTLAAIFAVARIVALAVRRWRPRHPSPSPAPSRGIAEGACAASLSLAAAGQTALAFRLARHSALARP